MGTEPRPPERTGPFCSLEVRERAQAVKKDLYTPVTSDTILEVRVGMMKLMEGLKILSGIDKQLCHGPVPVNFMGLQDDGHDYTFHGGVDKAVHAYCSAHYDSWKHDFPDAAERFRPGGFGENLVFARFNERNVHIGDVLAVGPSDGPGLVLQVSLPRQPCFKLNHRFGIKNFAPHTWRNSRTGWYYRVLRPGPIQAGDEVRLVDRPHPDWPLVRVQEFLHRQPDDLAMVEELAAIVEFGDECKSQLSSRLAKLRAKERRLHQGLSQSQELTWRPYRVAEKRWETARIAAFVLEAVEEPDQRALEPGSHVRLRLGNGLVRVYSVVGGDRQRFELGVARAENSRGGSQYLCEAVDVGSLVDVGAFSEAGVPMANAASHHVVVAGGVGITAFLTVLETMKAWHNSVELHYAVRSLADVPFRRRLDALEATPTADADTIRVHYYAADAGQRLALGPLVRGLPWNAHINFCGPPGLMEEARRETTAAGLGPADVHWEAFAAADTAGDPFDVVVKTDKTTKTLHVSSDETLLEVLQRHLGSDAVASSCMVGNCGTCKITVREGRVDHRGTALTEAERCAGDTMLACVSRGIGRIVVEM